MDKEFVNSNGRAEYLKFILGIGNRYEHLTKSCLLGYSRSFNIVRYHQNNLSDEQKDVILFAAAS